MGRHARIAAGLEGGRRPLPLPLALALGLALAGCDDHDHGHDHAEGADAHACEHFEGGPEAAVTLTAERSGAPEGFAEHTRVVATLVEIQGGNGGFLTLTVPEAGEYRLLTETDAAVALLPEGADAPAAPEASGAPDGCDAAAKVYVFDLPAGAHTLSVGPTPDRTFSYVLEAQGEHDH